MFTFSFPKENPSRLIREKTDVDPRIIDFFQHFCVSPRYLHMILLLDVGNTDATCGLATQDGLRDVFRIPSLREVTPGYYENQLRTHLLEKSISLESVDQVVLSSVVPSITPFFRQAIHTLFLCEPVLVDADIFPALAIQIDDPSEIGSDLIANAVAAYQKYRRNCMVIDFGTALTFTVVSGEGKIKGVSIVPGLRTAVKALFANTAQLPEVPLELPSSVIGTNTIHSIQAGILWGYEGLVRSMIRKIRREMGGDCIALATGGLSSIISTLHGEFVEVNVNLTLEGLLEIGKAHRHTA